MKILNASLLGLKKGLVACGFALLFSFSLEAVKEKVKKNEFDESVANKYRKNQDYENLERYLKKYLHGQKTTRAHKWALSKGVSTYYDPCVFYNLWRSYIHCFGVSTQDREYSKTILGWLIVFTVFHMADIKSCVGTHNVYCASDKDQTKRFELMLKNYHHRFKSHMKKISIDYSVALKKATELFKKVDYTKLPRPVWVRYVVNDSWVSEWVSFKTPCTKRRKSFSIDNTRQTVHQVRERVFRDMWKKLQKCKNWKDFFAIKETDIDNKNLNITYVDSDDEKEMRSYSKNNFDARIANNILKEITEGIQNLSLTDLKNPHVQKALILEAKAKLLEFSADKFFKRKLNRKENLCESVFEDSGSSEDEGEGKSDKEKNKVVKKQKENVKKK